ncbi:MAG: ABC transporter ATP-binding protein [Flavobacteriaceae bacterium]
MQTILKINNLSKNFGGLQAVNNVSFEIQKGKIYGILGPNGSGKSTTLGIALNVVNKTSGDFSWFEGSISHHEALKKVGAIIERPNFYPYMTAKQNLALVCKIKESDPTQIDEILKNVHLYERRNSKFKTFSLGMKQRLAIASALINEPEFLILDEPTNGLDPQGIHEIREIIKKIAKNGTTILLASHLLDEVEKICTDVVVLQKGNLIYNGPVSQMTSNTGLFLLNSNNKADLIKAIESMDITDNIEETNDLISFVPSRAIASDELNKALFEHGITLTHLEQRAPSLEEQFLQLTS